MPASAQPVEKMVALTDRAVIAGTIRRLEPKVRARVALLLEQLRRRKSLAEIEVLVRDGRLGEIVSDVDVRRMARAIAAETGAVYVAAAQGVSGVIAAALKEPVVMDPAVDRVVRHLADNRLRFVRDFVVEQRELVTEVLAEGLRAGANPRETARMFRDVTTLSPAQAKQVASYRRLLEEGRFGKALDRKLRDRRHDKAVRAAAKAGKKLPQARIDAMVSAYARRAVKLRAETIARTETLGAVHAGAEEGWQQAIDVGDIEPAELVRTWIATPGPRTRDSHRSMHRQSRKYGEAFTSGNGYSLRHPHDPAAPLSETAQCRCSVTTRIVPVEDQAAQEERAAMPKAKIPDGFERGAAIGKRAPVYAGAPSYKAVKENAGYVVKPSDLRERGVYALAGGGDDLVRMDRVRQGFEDGVKFGPIRLTVRPDGTFEVVDGRHRLLVAAETDRDVLVQIARGVAIEDDVAVRLLKALWPAAKLAA